MAGSSWSAFAKTVLIPLLIALALYVAAFLIILPIYRRHRSHIARYANYNPIGSGFAQQTTSLFSPYLIEPSKTLFQRLRGSLSGMMYRFIVPNAWARDRDARMAERLGDEDDEVGGGLFDAESGEAMVGFDIHENNLSRNGRAGRRLRGRGGGFRTPNDFDRHGQQEEYEDGEGVDDSNRRLSRELEEGFRDDSESEASDEEVTVGRRTVSRRGSDVGR